MPGAYDRAFSEARTGAILEFELLDSDLPPRGLAMGEIIGQGIDSGADVPVVYISPLAMEDVRFIGYEDELRHEHTLLFVFLVDEGERLQRVP